MQTGQPEHSQVILQKIETLDPETSQSLKLSTAMKEGALQDIEEYASCSNLTDPTSEEVQEFLDDYSLQALSVTKAKTLNALLPGAGYYYVGQKKAAATSLVINALFDLGGLCLYKKRICGCWNCHGKLGKWMVPGWNKWCRISR